MEVTIFLIICNQLNTGKSSLVSVTVQNNDCAEKEVSLWPSQCPHNHMITMWNLAIGMHLWQWKHRWEITFFLESMLIISNFVKGLVINWGLSVVCSIWIEPVNEWGAGIEIRGLPVLFLSWARITGWMTLGYSVSLNSPPLTGLQLWGK